jgi:hypothetical protein
MSVPSPTFFLYPKNYGTGKPLHGERGGYPLHPHCNSATLPPGTRGGKPRWGQLGCVEYPGMVDDTATGPPSRNRNLRSVSVPGPPLWQLSPTVSLVPLSHLCHAVAPAPSPGHRPLAAPRPAKGAPRPSPRGRAPAPGAAPPAAPWRAHRPRPTRAWTGGLVPLVPGVRGTVNEPRTWRFLAPRGRVAGLPSHSRHLSAARPSTRFPQCLRGFTAWQRVRGSVLPPEPGAVFLPPATTS